MRQEDRFRFPCRKNAKWQNQRAATHYYDAYKNLEGDVFQNWSIKKYEQVRNAIDKFTEETVACIATDVRSLLELVGVVCHLNMEWEGTYGKDNKMAKHYEKIHHFIHNYRKKYLESRLYNRDFFPPRLTYGRRF